MEENSFLRTDRLARKMAQREFRTPLAVRAGAGTGKTAILTARILVWSLGPGWELAENRLSNSSSRSPEVGPWEDKIAAEVLRRVVAITFTEAAAAEMAARVARGLWELQEGSIPIGLEADCLPSKDLALARARRLLANLDHLVVLTIHAFSLRLLTSYPLEAGLHPFLEVDAEGVKVEEMAREVLEPYLQKALMDPANSALSILSEEGLHPQRILEVIIQMAQRGLPLEALDEDFFSPSRVGSIRDSLKRTLGEFLQVVGSTVVSTPSRGRVAQEVVSCVHETCRMLEKLGHPSWEALEQFCEGLRGLWKDSLLKRLQDWGAGRFNSSEAKALGARAEVLAPLAGQLHDWLNHLKEIHPRPFLAAREVLRSLLVELYDQMRSKGVITFGWILRAARDLLKSHPHICSQVRRSVDQILVDEFQDTDDLQCEIIRLLALDGPTDERPGLFVVGDPKQSIYGWRNADLRAYEEFIEEILRVGGKEVSLNVNFRSAPSILEEIGRVMEPLMTYRKGIQPGFEPLMPSAVNPRPGFSRYTWCPVEYWVSQETSPGQQGKKTYSKGKATLIEAKALAKDILRLHTEASVPWSDIAVLFRTTGDLDIYLQALKELGIPYWVSKTKDYYRRREILEAISLLCTVLDPSDQVALVGHLRSSCAGVPDSGWISLWNSGLPGILSQDEGSEESMEEILRILSNVAQKIPRSIPGIGRIQGWQWSVAAAIHALLKLRSSFRSDPQDVFVERIKQLTLIELVEAAKYLGVFRVANLERFFRQLSALLEETSSTPHALLRSLRSAVKKERDTEEALPGEAGGEAVRIMTIHGAKGLDFPHVYIVQAHRGPREGGSLETHAERTETGWECSLFGWPSIGYLKIRRRAKEISRAEAVRTLYVAMTRAKERLVIAGSWDGDEGGRTYADLLKKRKGGIPELNDLLRESEGRNGELVHCDKFPGVVWRFPVTWPWEFEPHGRSGSIEWDKDVDEILKEDEELRAMERWAVTRMKRPWQAPMSKEAHIRLQTKWMNGERFPEKSYGGREVALILGRAFHNLLEEANFEEDEPGKVLDGVRPWLVEEVQRYLAQDQISQVINRINEILEALKQGRILSRLRELRESVIARELEVLLLPTDEWGPVGNWAGSIDMVYRDPVSGRIVAVDYKTDKIKTPEDLERLCRIYSFQGAGYVAALKHMLDLEKTPVFELWFLDADEIREIDTSSNKAAQLEVS